MMVVLYLSHEVWSEALKNHCSPEKEDYAHNPSSCRCGGCRSSGLGLRW